MNYNAWFTEELERSAKALAWAVEQLPAERQTRQPPKALGEWPAARHIFHLVYYEQTYALTGMRQWLGDPLPVVDFHAEDAAWTGSERVEDLLRQFQAVRQQQIDLLPKFNEADWQVTNETIWGPVTLLWVVTKTYQHTALHTSDILRMTLFWDRAAAREKLQE